MIYFLKSRLHQLSYTQIVIVEVLFKLRLLVLGGVVVNVLAIGSKVRRFQPGLQRYIFKGKNSVARLPSDGK
jgi:negative regulator of sigma E activity